MLTMFKDLHRGERCVLVCNGPSLNRMDLGFLHNEIVFGLNKIYLGLEKFGFYPRYLAAVNDKVIHQSAEAYRQMSCVKFLCESCADAVPADALTFHIWRANPLPSTAAPSSSPGRICKLRSARRRGSATRLLPGRKAPSRTQTGGSGDGFRVNGTSESSQITR